MNGVPLWFQLVLVIIDNVKIKIKFINILVVIPFSTGSVCLFAWKKLFEIIIIYIIICDDGDDDSVVDPVTQRNWSLHIELVLLDWFL